LKRLATAWRAFKASYAGLSDAQLMEPGVTGAWSVRDIIAHVTTWEEEALKHLPSILEGRRPPRYSVTYGGIDAFNAQMTTRKGGLSLSEVFRQLDDVHQRVIDVIERSPESHLISEARFRRRLRLDTYTHYPKHAHAIRRWRERQAGRTDAPPPGEMTRSSSVSGAHSEHRDRIDR
jgi:DinB superfamily